jgi:hypothetical protein
MTKTRKRRIRKRKVESTISNGRRKSKASLFGGAPGWTGPSTTTLLTAEGCDKTASARSSPTSRGTEETRAGCESMTDENGIWVSPMTGGVKMDGGPSVSSLRWIKVRINWKTKPGI